MRKLIKIFLVGLMVIVNCSTFGACTKTVPHGKKSVDIGKKVLFVLTSHDLMESINKPTGFNYTEVAHPWKMLYDAGFEIDFVSPKGGKAPAHRVLLDDSINMEFHKNKKYQQKITHTLKPNEVKADAYVGIYFAGGHGAMWDLAENIAISEITATIYENGGVVAAVCHGPAGLVNVKLKNGHYLIENKRINSFTNDEERSMNMENVVPFLLEDKIKERGGLFENSGIKQKHITIDNRIITGQNPASATGVGQAIVQEILKLNQDNMIKPQNFNGNAILIAPEIFGITNDMKSIAQKFSKQGYLPILLDFYQESNLKSFQYNNEDRDKALRLFKSLDKDKTIEYIRQSLKDAKQKYPEIKNFGYAGYSSGGYLGYWAAAEIPEIKATLLVSSGWITDGQFPLSKPSAPINFTKNIQGSMFLIAGEQDKLVTPEIIQDTEKSLNENNVDYQIMVLSDTQHGFYIKTRSSTYNANSTQKLWESSFKFFNQKLKNMNKKVLFVVTSHDKKGNTGQPTGYYLSEVSHPWEILHSAGYEIDFVSPKGGKAPVDGFNLDDSINKKFWKNETYRNKIENTLSPSEVNFEDYVAIHYAGGHGTMWDFPENEEIAEIAKQIYENNGVVSAVCHGPAGLVNIKLSNGKYLIDGKKINAFTNEEEIAVKLDNVVPFLLESKLVERGAIFEKSDLWQKHVIVDQRLVTGQNPQSAKGVGEATLNEIKKLSKK